MMQALWQAHRQFILRVAIGLAVFLILMNLAVGYRTDGKADARRMENDLLGVSEQLRDLDGRHQQEQRNADALMERGEEVLAKLSLLRNAEVAAPKAGDPPSIDFPGSKGRIWRAFTDRADRIHLSYPAKLQEISFDESADLTTEEWGDRYALLEVLRRLLDAGVTYELSRFHTIDPGDVITEAIPDDSELALVRYPVSIQVEAEYDNLLAFIGAFQEDRRYLSMEIVEIARIQGDAGRVEASLRAVGIDLGPPRDDGPRRPGGGFRRGVRR